MSCPTGAAVEHFGNVNGVDALNFPGRELVTLAGGSEKLAIEAQAVVSDQRGGSRPAAELAQHLLRA